MIKRQPREELGCLVGMFCLSGIVWMLLWSAHQAHPPSSGCGLFVIADMGFTAFAALFGAAIGQCAGRAKSALNAMCVGGLVPSVTFLSIVIASLPTIQQLTERVPFVVSAAVVGAFTGFVSYMASKLIRTSQHSADQNDK